MEPVELRGLNELAYCERLYYLMYVEKLFEKSADTIEGKYMHERRKSNSTLDLLDGADISSATLFSRDGALCGRVDSIKADGENYAPIEDKNSKMPGLPCHCELWGHKLPPISIWANDIPQILGQIYLLRDNGYRCSKGKVYYRGSNRIVDIEYLPEYDGLVKDGIALAQSLHEAKHIPLPLVDSEKCIRCSMNYICLPDEQNFIHKKIDEVRRLYPGRPDGGILYVVSNGAKIGKDGDCFSVWTPDDGEKLVPVKDVEHICVFGNVQVTTQAMREMVKNEGSISYFSYSGWFEAITSGLTTKNITLRQKQFSAFSDETIALTLSKSIVTAKIENQRTLLRRNAKAKSSKSLNFIKDIKKEIEEVQNLDSLRGFEGIAAQKYWDNFSAMVNDNEAWKIMGRNKRPPKDEINAMLSYGYSLLTRDFCSALASCGFDCLLGFFHAVVPGRPALALDMMEPYRPLIVDSTILRMVNENIAKKDDFTVFNGGVYMSPDIKKKLIETYEKRVDELITHPIFGYRLSYRRMFMLEAKLLAKYLTGDIDEYFPLTTR